MTFYCLIRQEMLNFVTNCCKLLKINQAAEQAVSSTVYGKTIFKTYIDLNQNCHNKNHKHASVQVVTKKAIS